MKAVIGKSKKLICWRGVEQQIRVLEPFHLRKSTNAGKVIFPWLVKPLHTACSLGAQKGATLVCVKAKCDTSM